MFEFILEALVMPRRVWFGIILGFVVAIGFLVGLISSFATEKNEKRGM
jgi:hypothetical protein